MPIQAHQVSTKEIIKRLRKEGLDIDPKVAEEMSIMQTFFQAKPIPIPEKGVMIIKDPNGKKFAIKINDPLLFETLQNFHGQQIMFVDEIFRPVARRCAVTAVRKLLPVYFLPPLTPARPAARRSW